MADETRGDYNELQQVAQRFAQQSEAIGEMLNAIKNAMDPLESDWIGDSAEAFRSEMDDDAIPRVIRLQEAMSTASEVTNQIAQNLRDADEEAKGFFSDWRA